MTKEEKDENGVNQKVTVLEYIYEQEMEPVSSPRLVRSFADRDRQTDRLSKGLS